MTVDEKIRMHEANCLEKRQSELEIVRHDIEELKKKIDLLLEKEEAKLMSIMEMGKENAELRMRLENLEKNFEERKQDNRAAISLSIAIISVIMNILVLIFKIKGAI